MSFGLGEFYSLSCALAWAIAVVLFKKSGESLAPFALNLFKNVLGVVLMVLTILLLQGAHWPAIPLSELPLILLSGVLGIAAGDTLYFRALNAIGASRIAVAQTLYSPFVIGLSLMFLGERLRPAQFLGVALVLCGILLVTYTRAGGRVDAHALRAGVGTAVLAMLFMAVGIVIAKPMLTRYDFMWVVMLRILGGAVGMLMVVIWRRSGGELMAAYRGVRHWPQVIVGAVMGTYISMLLWLAGYKYTKASIAAVINETAAVFILLLAVMFLRERVTARQVIGVVLAVGGVMMVVSL
jgi:drug/metabolite transporter (DMT)-like permease